MVALPGFPPLPISISRFLPDGIELTIRGAGPATKAMCALQVGEQLGLRGPLGNNWPLDRAVGRDLVIVTGGIGLAPLRPVLHAIVKDRSSTARERRPTCSTAMSWSAGEAGTASR
jgi:NAD(P)H-flavin reductase